MLNQRECRFLFLSLSVVVATAGAGEKPQNVVREAQRIRQAAGVTGGLIVHVGCGDGHLTAALHNGGTCLVHGLDVDVQAITRARDYLAANNLSGPVSVERWNGQTLPYVDDMVNLLVVQKRESLTDAEIQRVLTPNGVAVTLESGTGDIETFRKPWPADIDEWSHWLHAPDNNAVSKDQRVGISRSLQWYMPPRWSRHHNLPAGFNALVSAGGRIYYMVDVAPNAVLGPGEWVLIARDAFNGLELWRRPIPDWNMKAWGADERLGGRVGRFHGAPDYQAPRRIVATKDQLFVTPGFHSPVVALDGATGKQLRQYTQTTNAGEILYRNGRLFVARNTYVPEPGKEIMVMDAESGQTLWRNADYKGIAAAVGYQKKHTNAFMTLGEKNLFLVDENDIVALDLATGHEVWKQRMPLTDEIVGDIDYRYSNFCTLVYHDSLVYFAQIFPGTKNLNKWEMKKVQIQALDAATGKQVWDRVGGTVAHVVPPDLFIAHEKVWTFDPSLSADGNNDARLWGLDRRTGAIQANLYLPKIMNSHHHRCYRDKATEKYFLMGEEGIEYVNLVTGESDVHYWLRGACRYGVMPANGFIYVSPHNCACYLGTLLHGFLALKSKPTAISNSQPTERLFKGPAYDAAISERLETSATDWPMFRHDAMRSGYVPVQLPDKLSTQWKTALGGELTPPIIVAGRVYVASVDTNQVYCLDAGTGQLVWQFVADGPLNSAPTYAHGRIVFGTRTGSLYTLTAEDGQLAWQFHAGPAHVHIMAFERLESPWPLNGSPLVLEGNVYCVAGRSMNLDSGLFLYKLDLQTGRLVQQLNFHADTEPKGETEGSLLADILVSDGDQIYMKSMAFNSRDIAQHGLAGEANRHGATKKPQTILRCQTEMNDDSGLNCCFWAYRGCQAQQLVFDARTAYGVNGPHKVGWSGSFGHDVFRPGQGFRLNKWVFQKNKPLAKWPKVTVPVDAKAMVLTENHLYLAGSPDTAPADDFWAAYENREGGLLRVVSRDDASPIHQYPLDAIPVYNGMAANGEHLIVCLKGGTIAGFGEPTSRNSH